VVAQWIRITLATTAFLAFMAVLVWVFMMVVLAVGFSSDSWSKL
jgi:hypothetical protein